MYLIWLRVSRIWLTSSSAKLCPGTDVFISKLFFIIKSLNIGLHKKNYFCNYLLQVKYMEYIQKYNISGTIERMKFGPDPFLEPKM